MKRISTNHISLTRQHANKLLSEFRATRVALSHRPHRNRTDSLPSQFVCESATARYMTEREANSRRPLTDELAFFQDTIRFCEQHFRPVIERSLQEELYILTLDGAQRVLRTHSITVGLVNMTQVHPREVFRPAILDAATSVIAAHNHPSGNSKPSEADRKVTRVLVKAGELLGIKLLDHIILAREGSTSLRDCEPQLFN